MSEELHFEHASQGITDILKHKHSEHLGISRCDYSDVLFSDVSVDVGSGMMTTVVTDVEGDWHFAKRKLSGTWVNTGMFTQVWRKIAEGAKVSER